MAEYRQSDLARMSALGLRALVEALAEERDDAVEAWEECTSTVSELRAERDDAVREAKRWREIARKNGYEA